MTCPMCDGTGKKADGVCPLCHGDGTTKGTKKPKVRKRKAHASDEETA